MNITINKLALIAIHARLRWAEITHDETMLQDMHEQIVSTHIRLLIAREQAYNKQLFPSI